MILTLSDVLTPQDKDAWLAKILAIGSTLNLKTTAWQPGGVTRTILAIVSNLMAATDIVVSQVAAGGLLKFASAVTPEGGYGWLDLLADNAFDVQRAGGIYASGQIVLTNASGASYGPFPAGTYHIANPSTGKTYVNTASLTIAPSANTPAFFVADVSGSGSTSPASSITQTITTLVGVSIVSGSQSGTFTATDPESNASVVARCQLKLAALGPKLGNQSAYAYFSLTPTEPGYPLSGTPITRVKVTADDASGQVNVVVANASGAPSGGNVASLQVYLDGICTPDGETMVVAAASNQAITATMTAYVPAQYLSQVTSDAQAAYVAYLLSLPIGGAADEDGSTGVPHGGLQDAIARALPYLRTQSLNLMGAGEVSYAMTGSQVATASLSGLTVTPVAVA